MATPKDALAAQLKDLLQDTVQFKFLSHGAHWNVTGINFQQFHELFQEIYEDADSAIDPLAENIRKLNVSAPIQLTDYIESNEETGEMAPTLSTDPVELAKVVYAANEDCLECIVKGIILANAINEQGILNFLAERQDMHSKWQWQLRTIVGDGFADQNEVNVATVNPQEENEA